VISHRVLRTNGVGVQVGEEGIALTALKLDDMGCESRVDEEHLLTSFGMGADHRVDDRIEVRDDLALPPSLAPSVEDVLEGGAAVVDSVKGRQESLEHRTQVVECGLLVGPQSVPTRTGDVEGIQYRARGRARHEGHVGVPSEAARSRWRIGSQGIGLDLFGVVDLMDVGLTLNRRNHRMPLRQLAEATTEVKVRPVIEMLVREEDHLSFNPDLTDGGHRLVGQVAEVDAPNDGSDSP
jgi:hypothetical protein